MVRKQKRVAIYLRVSTTGQTVENQRRELEAVAERHGWEIAKVFADEGISGAKGREKRPGLDALCKGIARKEFDIVAAWSVDRLGRSLLDLIGFLKEIHAKGVDLYLDRQGIDTTTPAGKAMFQMMGVFAEFERAMIQERVSAGLARAKAQGKKLGRPREVDEKKRAAVLTAKAKGDSLGKIATALDINRNTVAWIVREARKKTEADLAKATTAQ
jgi:DNA invertase Pin-like site-specific DNA recombinase